MIKMVSRVFTKTQSLSPEEVTQPHLGGTPEGWPGQKRGEMEQKDRNRHIIIHGIPLKCRSSDV